MTSKQQMKQMQMTLFNEEPVRPTGAAAFKKMTTWMRSRNYGAEEGFHEICSALYGPAAPKLTKLDLEQFNTAMLKLGFAFPKEQVTELFDLLDMNKDGMVDIKDWSGQMPEQGVSNIPTDPLH